MKIKILKTNEGYEIEVPDEELLSLLNKFLESINKYNEEEAKKMGEKVQDILSQILGGGDS
jgi:hypothetical protein